MKRWGGAAIKRWLVELSGQELQHVPTKHRLRPMIKLLIHQDLMTSVKKRRKRDQQRRNSSSNNNIHPKITKDHPPPIPPSATVKSNKSPSVGNQTPSSNANSPPTLTPTLSSLSSLSSSSIINHQSPPPSPSNTNDTAQRNAARRQRPRKRKDINTATTTVITKATATAKTSEKKKGRRLRQSCQATVRERQMVSCGSPTPPPKKNRPQCLTYCQSSLSSSNISSSPTYSQHSLLGYKPS